MKKKIATSNSEFDRFAALAKQVISVPKAEIDKRLAAEKKAKEPKKKAKN